MQFHNLSSKLLRIIINSSNIYKWDLPKYSLYRYSTHITNYCSGDCSYCSGYCSGYYYKNQEQLIEPLEQQIEHVDKDKNHMEKVIN